MADLKISQLGSIVTVVPATDVLPVVQGATTYKMTPNQILGSGGVATLASATITGDLTVDTSTLKVDSTNNRVGIGTATPGYPLEVVGNAVFSADATCKRFFVNDTTGTANAYINSADGSTSNIFFGGQTNYNIGAIIYDDASNFLAFRTNSVEAARFNSTGNLVLKGGTAAANGVGITFPAAQVASSDANCLDDYEEGTWTIGFSFGGGSTGITYIQNTGKYTKVGRLVTVFGAIDLSSKGSSTGNAAITGLPFTVGGASSDYSAASLHLVNITFADFPMGFGNPTTTTIPLQEVTNAGVRTNLTDADFANNSSMIFSLTYSV